MGRVTCAAPSLSQPPREGLMLGVATDVQKAFIHSRQGQYFTVYKTLYISFLAPGSLVRDMILSLSFHSRVKQRLT